MSVTKVLSPHFSPSSGLGSFIYSILAHVTACGLVVGFLHLSLSKAPVLLEDPLDLGYEVFDEPPVLEKQVQRVQAPAVPTETQAVPDSGAKELQDDHGTVAGAQTAVAASPSGTEGSGNVSSSPYYKIKPKYPKAALLSGTEGWVLMQVDINETGEVENIRVVDGEQRNTFQSEARRAVSQWKYRPFVDGSGQAFRKKDHQVRVDFKIKETTEL